MSVTAVPIRPLSRGSVLKLWLGLLVLVLLAVGFAWAGTRSLQRETLPSGVQIQVMEEGEGATVTPADLVALRYKLRKTDGTLIQDSDQTGQPFVTSTQGLFPGFAEGLQHMRQHGRYRLWLPPGQHVQSQLPPDAPFTAQDTLVFDIQVLQIAPGMAAMQQMMGPPGASAPPGAVPPGAASPHPVPEGAEGPAAAAPPPAGNSQR